MMPAIKPRLRLRADGLYLAYLPWLSAVRGQPTYEGPFNSLFLAFNTAKDAAFQYEQIKRTD